MFDFILGLSIGIVGTWLYSVGKAENDKNKKITEDETSHIDKIYEEETTKTED